MSVIWHHLDDAPPPVDLYPDEDYEGEACLALATEREPFGCTRMKGHDGPHVAYGDRDLCMVWEEL